ncbi:hypothetical protein QL898_05100 [Psychrobacter sp. APC 3279]|uniref:hypothetical protein n=1 Tax=Psychrobacter sp. APC 3279 TaxID=3035189 RepID=UPI0025B470EC|nr:hypothetical protein [Psychrobacter sp. APC 3279]MDN3440999.1 hypothetical protein [Psychrobacter sp. APC 3279]|tara:strand:- start:151 stop:408 length:258 start_codon:yes stop_codon:yes gene_type:complete
MKNNNKKFEKDSSAADSSADSVDEYLQTLGNEDARELRYYSQEQPFSAEEMTRLVNEERLNELLAQSDAFLSSLNGEINDFDDEY